MSPSHVPRQPLKLCLRFILFLSLHLLRTIFYILDGAFFSFGFVSKTCRRECFLIKNCKWDSDCLVFCLQLIFAFIFVVVVVSKLLSFSKYFDSFSPHFKIGPYFVYHYIVWLFRKKKWNEAKTDGMFRAAAVGKYWTCQMMLMICLCKYPFIFILIDELDPCRCCFSECPFLWIKMSNHAKKPFAQKKIFCHYFCTRI